MTIKDRGAQEAEEKQAVTMQNMTLQHMADACHGKLFCKEEVKNREITCAVLDSRKIEEGGLFFAAVGEKTDGHKFIGQVFEKGALCVVTEKTPEEVWEAYDVPTEAWGAYILVEDTFAALKQIAAYYRQGLTIPVVGITGSVGKTSTKEFVAGVLAEKYRVLKTEGNFNNEIGLPLTLLRIRKEHEAAVVEMGISDFGEMSRLGAMAHPDICVITNIGQCHLENLHDRAGIFKAKTEIFAYMAPNGEVCLNGEDDMLKTVGKVNGRAVHYFGLSAEEDMEVYATGVENLGLLGSRAVMHIRQHGGTENGENAEIICPIEISLPGQHMIINAMAAAQVGRILNLRIEEIAEGIRNVKPVGGRSNLLKLSDKIVIDDCYNANPVSMKAALDLLKTALGRKVALLGDMFELGENTDAMHGETGAYAVKQGIDVICCIGEKSRYMYEAAMEAVTAQKNDAVQTAVPSLYYFADREALLQALPGILQPADTILVKASHGMGFDKVVENIKSS